MNRMAGYLDHIEIKQQLTNKIDTRKDKYLVSTFDILGMLAGQPVRLMDRGVISMQVAMLINTIFVLTAMMMFYCSRCHNKWKCCNSSCSPRCRKKNNVPEI